MAGNIEFYITPKESIFSDLNIAILPVILLYLSYSLIIYPHFVCGLRHIPGPYISKVTSLWFTYQGYKNETNQYIHTLHNQYGKVVRITPDIVSFNSVEGINPIYGVRSRFPKPQSSSNMDNYGCPNTFSSVSNEDHRLRRNRYASIYSKSNMTQGEGYDGIFRRTRQVTEQIKEATSKDQSVDIYKLFHYYAMDNASVIACGTSLGLLDGRNLQLSQDLRNLFISLAYVFYFPFISFLRRLAPAFSSFFIPKHVLIAFEAHQRVRDTNLEHYRMSSNVEAPEFKNSVLARLQEHNDYASPGLTDMHVASEVCDHLLAGADTVAAGIVYTFWELTRADHRPSLNRLINEVKSVTYPEDGQPVSYTTVEGLVWLECCVREGLRLHTPSGHIQARVVSHGGEIITGYFIPQGTEVGIPLYSIQLNADIFEDPYSFKPERWLEEKTNPEKLQRMRQAWLTFGHGARICVAKELALVEMNLLLAMIFHEFSARGDEEQDQEEMQDLQMAVLAPKGQRCLIRFSNLRESDIKSAEVP